MVKDLPEGMEIIIPGRGGWECVLTRRHEGFDINIRCPETSEEGDPTGRHKFFTVDTCGNQSGEPMAIQEPTLGVQYRNDEVDVNGRIIGAIVLNADGKITKGFLWSKLVYVEKRGFEITPTGLLFEQDHAGTKFLVGHLYALLLSNSILNEYVGVFCPTKPAQVKVLEMEDLLLASL